MDFFEKEEVVFFYLFQILFVNKWNREMTVKRNRKDNDVINVASHESTSAKFVILHAYENITNGCYNLCNNCCAVGNLPDYK